MNELIDVHKNVTEDQLELIKKTVAQGATEDELRLYLYDCKRQGVHPLDKLIHFTKRGGKYVPVTSIDFMRQQAAQTGDYLGCTKPEWAGNPGKPGFKVSMVAKRLIHGTHVAEHWGEVWWEEYYPGEQGGHMWRKMPHVMLAKVCEAVCLRKGFPKELSGLYAKEEMDQAGNGSAFSPTSEAIAPNTLIDGVVLDYEPKEGEKPHKIRVGLADGDVTFTQHRFPCSEALLANCLGTQVKLSYRKQGKFMELTEIQPQMAQTAIETPEAPQDMDGWEGGTIKAYGTKNGVNKNTGKPWTLHRFDFLTTEGKKVSASTFSLSAIGWEPENIYIAIEAQTDVRFQLAADGKYWTLMALELVDGESDES